MDERRSMVQHPLFIVRNIFRGENVKHEAGRIPVDEREDNYHLPNIFSWSRSKTFLSLSFSPPLSLSPSLEALIKIQDLVVLFLYKEMPAETRGAIQAFVTLLVIRCNNTVFHYHSIAFLNWKTNWNRADCAVSLWFSHSFRNWHSLKMFEFWSKNQRYRQILRLRRVVRPETQFAE